jgi:poly-gamma-glutamate synthesis protein (capsule biosynthesis protein)
MIAVGDCFPNGRFYADGAPISPRFAETLALMREADVRFGNFEMPLTARGNPAEKLAAIRADPGIAVDVKELGFDLLSLANNHAFDYGMEGLSDTTAALTGIGVRTVGAGSSLAEATSPLIIPVRDARVGFLAFSCLVAAGTAASAERGGVAPIHVNSGYEINPYWAAEEPGEPGMVTIRTHPDADDQARAEDLVRQLRAEVDILCVSVHWGYGSSKRLAEYQRPLGHALIDAGADAVLGNHVHAVQGIEIYREKPILYSPGTFIGRQIPVDLREQTELMRDILLAMSPDGYLAKLDFGAGGSCSVSLVPISIDEHGLPVVARGDVLDRILSRVYEHSAQLDTKVGLVAGSIVPLSRVAA